MSSDEIPQPSHVTLRVEYSDGQVLEFSAGNPRQVKLDLAIPAGALDMARHALRESPYLIPKMLDRTRHVEISLDAEPTEQIWIRDSRATVAVSRDDLMLIHAYARHFDVDDDPAMIRVAAILRDSWAAR